MKQSLYLGCILIIIEIFSISQSFSQSNNNTDNSKSTFVSNLMSGSYSFSYDTGTFKYLSGAKNMTAGQIWDSPLLACPIGFRFKFFDEFFETANVTDPYFINFGTDIGMGYKYYITAYGADLVDRGFGELPAVAKSPISYLLTGTTPNRIFKVEWKNAAFLNENICYNTRTNYINLQLWLYETSNNIEIHFGPNHVTYADSIYPREVGPDISLTNYVTSKYVSLVGDSTKPILSGLPEQNINGTPPNGIIYKFSSGFVDIADKQQKECSFYPNPVKDVIHILLQERSDLTNIQVTDILGNVIINKCFMGTDHMNIIVNTLPHGIYILNVQNSSISTSKKFTIR